MAPTLTTANTAVDCTAGRVQALGFNILGANASPVAMYDSKAYGLTRLLGMWWAPLVGEKCFTS